MQNYAALILAAGKGTRMKSGLCKVVHRVAGRPMISYVVDAARTAELAPLVIVVGHHAGQVKEIVGGQGVSYAVQEPQLGTGHAVAAGEDRFRDFEGHVLILCGDIPLIEPETLRRFIAFHEEKQSLLSVMTTYLENPFGYGRIIRNPEQRIDRIVEERDASEEEKSVKEINTGVYLVEAKHLFALLKKVEPDNAQGEYYLTDIVSEAVKESLSVEGFVLGDAFQATGINTRKELARVSGVIRERIRDDLMNSGVTLIDPAAVYIDAEVRVGPDTIIHPGVTLSGRTEIGSECVIEPGVYISDSSLGDRVRILLGSRLDRVIVDEGTSVGPMAHLRPEARIGKNVRIGNFVEVKKSVIGDGTKASHLTYLGDSLIGKDVNVGCGTITCNYDGKHKHTTVIHDRCFVGSDVQFVAPVEIGEGCVIGAGSTITKDVPPKSLAVSRVRQKVYELRRGQGSDPSDEDRKS